MEKHQKLSVFISLILRHKPETIGPVILTIKSGEMYKDGIKFYKSENNVWLVDFIVGKYLEMK